MTKYGNRKTVTSDGVVHDSKKEAVRWTELKLMEKAGLISDLKRQVKYELIPSQCEYYSEVKNGKVKHKYKVLERACYYIADFVYQENGKTVVEDTKGMRTKDYVIKRKLMLYLFRIKIKEI